MRALSSFTICAEIVDIFLFAEVSVYYSLAFVLPFFGAGVCSGSACTFAAASVSSAVTVTSASDSRKSRVNFWRGAFTLISSRRALPFSIASQIALTMIRMDLTASSLPGIAKSASEGSVLVSTIAITGIPRRLASATAIYSFLISITKSACGVVFISSIPSKLRCIRSISRRMTATSFLYILSNEPSVSIAKNFLYLFRLFVMVEKLVNVPPNQRLAAKGIATCLAASRTIS